MADDDRAVMDRLAALEAEVKADADAQQARKAAALAKLREQRVTDAAASDALRARQAELLAKKRPQVRPMPPDASDLSDAGELEDLEQSSRSKRPARSARARDREDDALDLSGALELASKANKVKQELTRAPEKGDKSWIKSGVASLFFGPVGWLYAGSWREAVPAGAAWVVLGTLALKILPMILLMPVLMVVAPLSAIAGVVYALQYNRNGSRQRLFSGDKEKPQKQLRGGDAQTRKADRER